MKNEKINRLTQRLDHMVPDPKLTSSENKDVAEKLASISDKLYSLLPDPSLSPDERLERLARVTSDRIPQTENLLSAHSKLNRLVARLDELIPGSATPEEKIDNLVELLNVKSFDNSLSIASRLEEIGDEIAGIKPIEK